MSLQSIYISKALLVWMRKFIYKMNSTKDTLGNAKSTQYSFFWIKLNFPLILKTYCHLISKIIILNCLFTWIRAPCWKFNSKINILIYNTSSVRDALNWEEGVATMAGFEKPNSLPTEDLFLGPYPVYHPSCAIDFQTKSFFI